MENGSTVSIFSEFSPQKADLVIKKTIELGVVDLDQVNSVDSALN